MWLGKLAFYYFFCHFLVTLISGALEGCTEESCHSNDLKQARDFLTRENELLRQRRHLQFLTAYTYNINVTEYNSQQMNIIAVQNAVANKQLALEIKQRGFASIDSEDVQRQVEILGDLGFDVLPEADYKYLRNAIKNMQTNYATTTVCSYENATKCDLALEPHVQDRLSHSRDAAELAHYWKQWHDKAGTPMRDDFKQYVKLSAKAAQLNNFSSYADYWIHFYDDPQFEANLDAAFQVIFPFYKELHGYVRYRLRQHYGDDVVPANGYIPMQLLGNMWAQQWNEAIDLYTPYPKRGFLDVTAELRRQNYSVEQLFQLGDDFFKSLNMLPLPPSFWNLSMLERPVDRQVVCHASAWDLYDNSDVRIKMCTQVDSHYLFVVHHELGHIQYYLQYEKQPTAFRGAPNPGFHEAVGDVIALSVMTMKHFKRIGLATEEFLDAEGRINELFKTALKKIVFLPFAYTMDKYRYAVFRGEINETHWKREFWKMRAQFTGVEPPVARTDDDFDPPAKYHVDADVEYLRYFAAHIFQFQLHKALCTKAQQYKPGDDKLTLDNCDIYNSKEAGAAFSKFLSLGSSKKWTDTLQELTGDTTMDPSALLEYFEPLRQWLHAENKRLGVPIGWE